MERKRVNEEFKRIKSYILASDDRSAMILLNILLKDTRDEARDKCKTTLAQEVGLALIAGNYEDLHLGSVWDAAADIAETWLP